MGWVKPGILKSTKGKNQTEGGGQEEKIRQMKRGSVRFCHGKRVIGGDDRKRTAVKQTSLVAKAVDPKVPEPILLDDKLGGSVEWQIEAIIEPEEVRPVGGDCRSALQELGKSVVLDDQIFAPSVVGHNLLVHVQRNGMGFKAVPFSKMPMGCGQSGGVSDFIADLTPSEQNLL
jgi:hypothetical protein